MRLLSFGALKREKGIEYSRVHLTRLVNDRKFPRPIPLGGNRIAWIEEEIDAWIQERMSEREAA